MPIDYGNIRQVLGIRVEIVNGSGSHLIELELKYNTMQGWQSSGYQTYIYQTRPKIVYKVLDNLIKRRLVKKEVYREIRARVKSLEKMLISG